MFHAHTAVAASALVALVSPSAVTAAADLPDAPPAWSVVSTTSISDLGPDIAIDSTDGDVYVPTFAPRTHLAPARSRVVVVSPATGKVVKRFALPHALSPGMGALAFDPASKAMYVPYYGSSAVGIIDTATDSLAQTVATQARSMPWGAAFDTANGVVYVTDGNDNGWLPQGAVYAIDAMSHKVVDTIDVPDSAGSPGVDPVAGRLFVPIEQNASGDGGEIVVIDTTTDQVVDTISTDQFARDIVVDPVLHRAYVLSQTGVTVFDTQTDAQLGATAPVDGGYALALDPSDHQVFVSAADATQGSVVQIDGTSGQVVASTPIAGADNVLAIAVDPLNHHVFVEALSGSGTRTRSSLVQLAQS